MVEIYWGCLITGILFTILTIIFDDLIGNAFDNILDAFSFNLPDFFQPTVLMSGITAFGAAGVLLTSYTSISTGIVIFLSICAALILSMLSYFVYVRPMKHAETSTGFSVQDLVGMIGEVTVPIPKEGFGEVILSIGGVTSNQIAASFEQLDIKAGEKILVIEVSEDAIFVSPYNQ